MSTLESLQVEITGDATALTRELNNVQNLLSGMAGGSLAGFGSMTSSLLGLGSAFDIIKTAASETFDIIKNGAMSFLQGGFDFSRQIENNTIAFETLTGSSEKTKKIMDDIQILAAQTPFEFPELAKSAKVIKNAGFSLESIPYMLTSLGDAASATGLGAVGLDRVTLAITQMAMKGKVGAEEMTRQLGQILPAWDLLAAGMGKSVAEVQQMSKKGLLDAATYLPILIDQIAKKYKGNMEKMSKTVDGLMSTIRDNLNMLSALLQVSALYKLKDVMKTIASATGSMIASIKAGKNPLEAMASIMQDIFGREIMQAIMPFVYAVTSAFNALKTTAIAVFQALAPIVIAALGFIAPIFLYFATLIEGLANAFAGLPFPVQAGLILAGFAIVLFGLTLLTLIPIVFGISTAILGLVMVIGALGVEVFIITGVLLGVVAIFALVVGALVAFGIGLYVAWQQSEDFRNFVTSAFSQIYDNIAIIISNIATVIAWLWPYVQQGFSFAFGVVLKILQVFATGTLTIVNKVLQFFAGLTEAISGTFSGNWGKAWNGVKMMFADVFNAITSIAAKAINGIIDLVNKGLGALSKIKLPDFLGGGGLDLGIGKISHVTPVKLTYKTSGKGVGGKIGMDVLKGIKDSISKGWNKGKGIIKKIKDFKLPKPKKLKVDTSKPKKLFDKVSKPLPQKAAKGKKGKKPKKKKKKKDNKLKKQMDDVSKEVTKFVENVQKQAEGIIDFGNLFEKVLPKKMSGEKLKIALKSQLAILNAWRNNLSSIGKRIGTNSNLYQELLSRGPEAADEIAALAKMTPKQLAEYNRLFKQKTALAYQMGYKMEAAAMAKEIKNQQFVFNITGNKITDEFNVDKIANKIIQKLKIAGVY